MANDVQFVNKQGNPIEFRARSGNALDVGFGGNIERLMEKLSVSKQVMDIAEERFPYEMTGTKTKGKITKTIGNEGQEFSSKVLNEQFDDEPMVSKRPSSIKDLKKTVEHKKQELYEQDDQEYMYYNTGEIDDDIPEKNRPSLTSELLKYGGEGQLNQNLDVSGPISEEAFRKSKIPDFIKESFKKHNIQPPSMSVALGGGQLDTITKKMKSAGYVKEKQQPQQQVKQKKRVISENRKPITKREKIKEQLRPLVEELITEILAKKLLS